MSLFYSILLCLVLGSKKAVGQNIQRDPVNEVHVCYAHQYYKDVPYCLRGYQQIGDKFYYIPVKGSGKVNWHKAWQMCRQRGGFLASFDNIVELKEVANTIYWNGFDVKENFWTDGNDLAQEGIFTWFENGILVEPSLFTPGEPNKKGIERCLHIWTAYGQHFYGLNNIECDKKQYYVCMSKVINVC